jgi:hypothetical protein
LTPKKPVLVASPKPEKPLSVGDKEAPPKKWTFGFSSFRQIEFFGLSRVSASWFVSVLQKLQMLSLENVDDFRGDVAKKTKLEISSYKLECNQHSDSVFHARLAAS